jgi:hypothetical protein
MSLTEWFVKGVVVGLASPYRESVRAIAKGDQSKSLVHTAIHNALMSTEPLYQTAFNKYAAGLKATNGAVSERVKELEGDVAFLAFAATIAP